LGNLFISYRFTFDGNCYLTDSNGEIISITSCATTTTTTSTTSTTTEPPVTTTTTTTTTTDAGYYYFATQYLNCVQNSAVDAFILFSPSLITESWVCGDDVNQYLLGNETTPQAFTATIISSSNNCAGLSC
jgi:hypothetical protein